MLGFLGCLPRRLRTNIVHSVRYQFADQLTPGYHFNLIDFEVI